LLHPGKKGRDMTRKTLYLPALLVAAVLVACAGALLAVSEKAEATFPGKNGKIAYVRNDGNDDEIYTINPGGGGKTQLTHDNTGTYVPAYSPDGQRIVYSGSSGSGDAEIYTISAGGGDKTQLTHNNNDEFDPDYSPNGKRIAYTGLNRGYNKSAIYTISVRGGGKSKVTEGSDPSYSPDGKKIAYTVYKGPLTGIYKINVGGGGKFQVTPRLEYAESPSWRSRP
jgi:Tol biopolymer transport system component